MKTWGKMVVRVLLISTMVGMHAQPEVNLTLLGQFNPYPSTGYNDCWGYTAPDGREYALLGVKSGTSVVDITDPSNLHEVGFIPSNFSTWKDIKTYQHYAYIVIDASGNGLQIVDLSGLPNSVSLVHTYTGSGFASSHNIYIDQDTGILYAEGGGGVRVISLDNPLQPQQLSTINIGSIHDVFAQDGVLYVSEGWSGTFSLWDISNPADITLIDRFNTPTNGYAHNAYATSSGDYLLTTEEVPQGLTLKVWDIREPGNISLADQYIASNNGRPHNVHVKGDYAYVAHYWDGLRILDISNPDDVEEVAFYDTYPDLAGGYNGNWGTYPYYKSGKVLASDITYGLFLFFFDGAVDSETVLPTASQLPEAFRLAQNYPNPFNPVTTIAYDLPLDSQVTLEIFDLSGRKVRTLVRGFQSAGKAYSVSWDARSETGQPLSSGIYFYRLKAVASNSQYSRTMRMIYLR